MIEERHILRAFVAKARVVISEPQLGIGTDGEGGGARSSCEQRPAGGKGSDQDIASVHDFSTLEICGPSGS